MQLEHFYGQGCSNTNFITVMIERLKNNEPSIDLTLGEQKRDFVYIDDIVSAYRTVIDKYAQISKKYTEFQVSTTQLITIKELMNYLKEITNSNSKLNFGAIPYRTNELMHSQTDNSNLVNLGWSPKFDIREGLIETIK